MLILMLSEHTKKLALGTILPVLYEWNLFNPLPT
jgi:hypothetical protein